jgi:hypothetical protein
VTEIVITPSEPPLVEITPDAQPSIEVTPDAQPSLIVEVMGVGPPGPIAVSMDPGNLAKLGEDNLILVDPTEVDAALPRPFYLSIPIEAEIIFLFPIAVEFPAEFDGSIGYSETAPSIGAVQVTLAKNNVAFGYVTWMLGDTVPTWSSPTLIQFQRGDRLKVTPPTNLDPAFQGGTITLVGQRL